jgi:F-type H+-transporting ATPase subunit delta
LGIASRYASALFDLAKEGGALKALEADATALGETLAASEDLRNMIASPVSAAKIRARQSPRLARSWA